MLGWLRAGAVGRPRWLLGCLRVPWVQVWLALPAGNANASAMDKRLGYWAHGREFGRMLEHVELPVWKGRRWQ